MNKFGKLLIGAALATGATAASAEKGVELLVNSFKIGSETQITFDVVGQGATAMDFAIDLPNAGKLALNLDGCVSGLPATHQGQCALVGNQLKVVIYSPTNELLPAGEIGFVSVDGRTKFKTAELNAFGPDGKPLDRRFASRPGRSEK